VVSCMHTCSIQSSPHHSTAHLERCLEGMRLRPISGLIVPADLRRVDGWSSCDGRHRGMRLRAFRKENVFRGDNSNPNQRILGCGSAASAAAGAAVLGSDMALCGAVWKVMNQRTLAHACAHTCTNQTGKGRLFRCDAPFPSSLTHSLTAPHIPIDLTAHRHGGLPGPARCGRDICSAGLDQRRLPSSRLIARQFHNRCCLPLLALEPWRCFHSIAC
jgi:hypothetical protein